MRRFFLILTLILFLAPAAAPGHPGMTDRYDGHKCFKKCEDWNILYGEYHLHDKDRKPIRVAKKPKPVRQKKAVPAVEEAEAVLPQEAAAPVEPVRQVVVIREQNVSPLNLLLLLLLALLILWLILRMNRQREYKEEGRSKD